ncbi:MAG: two pore domain potassium channel family protein [Rhodomicrobium sp.]|nr:two pore domain potassium channel family protein [Rhodomicrobium sp.]
MPLQLLIGSAIISATIVIHVVFTAMGEWALKREHLWPGRRAGVFRFVTLLVGMTLLLLASISICVWLWAFCLMALGVFGDTETAVYFALVSFTTLGFGDIVLEKDWRILSGLMAANGLLVFGLTTAVLVDFLSRVRRS